MLLVSECVAQAALKRTESRGGHTRDDHPGMDAQWRNRLLVCKASGGDNPVVPEVTIEVKPQEPMREDLLALFDLPEVEKYYTETELAGHPGRQA